MLGMYKTQEAPTSALTSSLGRSQGMVCPLLTRHIPLGLLQSSPRMAGLRTVQQSATSHNVCSFSRNNMDPKFTQTCSIFSLTPLQGKVCKPLSPPYNLVSCSSYLCHPPYIGSCYHSVPESSTWSSLEVCQASPSITQFSFSPRWLAWALILLQT